MRQIRLAQRPKPLCSIFNRRHGGHMRNWVGPPLSGVHCGSDRMFGPWGTYVTTGAFGKFASPCRYHQVAFADALFRLRLSTGFLKI